MDSVVIIIFLIGSNITYSGILGLLIIVKLKENNVSYKKLEKCLSLSSLAFLILGIIYTLGISDNLRNSALLQMVVLIVVTVMLGVHTWYFRKVLIIDTKKIESEKKGGSSD